MDRETEVRLDRIERTLRHVESLVKELSTGGNAMASQLDQLQQQVTQAATVGDSMMALIQGLAQQIQSQKNDPQALDQMANDLRAKTQQWQQAVTANTPQANLSQSATAQNPAQNQP